MIISKTVESGIYRIKNLINNKLYIGSAVNFKERWREHKNTLKRNKHHSIHLQNAWNKYGKENFEFKIMETVNRDQKHLLIPIEQWYFNMFTPYERNVGYNICKTTGSTLGRICNKKTKKKIKNTLKELYKRGYNNWNEGLTKETDERVKEYGEKISIAKKGKPGPNLDKKFTKKHCKNLSISKKGCPPNSTSFKKGNIPWNKEKEHKKIQKPILQFDLNNNFIKEWNSITEAGKKLNIYNQNISAVCKNKRKTAGGFKWKYA